VFQLYATLKQPSASSSNRNAIGTPLVCKLWPELHWERLRFVRSNQHASSSVLQPHVLQNLTAGWIKLPSLASKNSVRTFGMSYGSFKVASTRTCLGFVWWITRSFGTAPWDLYLANQTGQSVIDALASTCTFGGIS
jgi:hypothetical protein